MSDSSSRLRLGRRGEEAVAEWYAVHGCTVLARNWRCPLGELDLVVFDPATSTLVCCEVKTRTSGSFGTPWDAVTADKQRRLRRLAGRLAAQRPPTPSPFRDLRIDVAAVTVGGDGELVVEVLEGAC
ncbi:MAG: YraN family protein [Acidimicrobiales bacterium]